MSLIKCPECGNNVSDKAEVCIHCGYPIAEYVASLNSSQTTTNVQSSSISEKQRIFTNSIDVYNQAKGLIDYLIVDVKRFDANYTANNAKVQFDLVLQSILLQIAIADRRIDPMELEFINKIVDHGDLMREINSVTNLNLSWNSLLTAPGDALINIIKLSQSIAALAMNELAKRLAFVDALHPEVDYGMKLAQLIVNITSGIAQMDDGATEAEANASGDAIVNGFVKQWADIKSQAIAML